MFEREIKFIYDFNLNKVNRLGPYFTFEQLQSSDLHPAILQYVSAEIDYLIYEDRQKLLKNSLFDYSGEKISFHFNQISEEAKKSKRFAQEYIAKLILHASSFTINYLVRPKWTLTKFVFDEENHKSTNDIKQILNYVYYYKYQNKILVSYINSKKILSMNAQEFEDLLNKADKLGVETYLPAILTNALKSMAEFFNIGEIQKTKIPLSAVEMFLEEKELIKHLRKVVEIFGNDEGSKFNLNDYQKVFDNIVLEKEELISEPEEPQKFETEETEEEPVEIEEEEIESDYDEVVVKFEKKDQEYEHEEEIEELEEPLVDDPDKDDSPEVEIDEEQGEEIIISQPLKLRIKVNEDNRIEPVVETPNKQSEEKTGDKDQEELFKELTEISDEEEYEDELIEADETEEDYVDKEQDEKIRFQDELNLAQKEFDNEEDESFLQSIREQNDGSLQEEEIGEDENSSFAPIEEKTNGKDQDGEEETIIVKDKSEWPIFRKVKTVEKETDQESEDEFIQQPIMDMAEILENKEMTKIIEVVFDYDIEDFAATLDEISNCNNEEDANIVINNTLSSRHVNRNSKEAETFRSIISEYFNKK